MCMWGSGLANAALFALVLPFVCYRVFNYGPFDLNHFPMKKYIIMAMRASPVPKYPFNPLSDSTAETKIQYPSPLVPIRLGSRKRV